MPEPSRDNMQRALASLVSDREAVRTRERELIAALRRLLEPLGYHLVPTATGEPGRPANGRRRRPPRAAARAAAPPAPSARRGRRAGQGGARRLSRA
jgi:hypothetical protein